MNMGTCISKGNHSNKIKEEIDANITYESYASKRRTFESQNQLNDGVKYFQECIKSNPKDECAYACLGVLYYNLKKHEEAEK